MNEISQAIAELRREAQLSECQWQIQARRRRILSSTQKGSKTYVPRGGVIEDGASDEISQSTSIIPIRVKQPKDKAAIEVQLGNLEIKFIESPA